MILDYQYGGYEPPAPRGVHGNRGGKGKPLIPFKNNRTCKI